MKNYCRRTRNCKTKKVTKKGGVKKNKSILDKKYI